MTPIDQEIEAQVNLNWVQFQRDNQLTILFLGDGPSVLKTVEEIYKTAFRSGINEAFRQASLAAEQELNRRSRPIGGF